MNENLNLVEILKDCPEGTKLYSPLVGESELKRIDNSEYPIVIHYKNGSRILSFTKEGLFYSDEVDGECMIFPSKDQRDWSKFTAPWYKKEMDTIARIEKQGKQEKQVHFPKFTFDDVLALQCCMETVKKVQEDEELYEKLNLIHSKMYDAYWIENQGETSPILSNSSSTGKNEQKSDDKVEPKFKVGNWYQCTKSFYGKGVIFTKNTAYYCAQKGCLQDEYECHIAIVKDLYDNFKLWTIQDAKDGDVLAAHECYVVFKEIDGLNIKCYCTYHYLGLNPSFYRDTLQNKDAFLPATKEQRDAMMKAINDTGYEWDSEKKELRELIKPKFDPNTLQPFERVLVKNDRMWHCAIFSNIRSTKGEPVYDCCGVYFRCCIPYNEETKHLLGTTEEAPEFYRYWED